MHEDKDDVEGRDRVERVGTFGREKVLEDGESLRSDTFLPHESSPYIAAESL